VVFKNGLIFNVWKIVLAMCGDFWFNWGMIQTTLQEIKKAFDSGFNVIASIKLNRLEQTKKVTGLEFNSSGFKFNLENGYCIFAAERCFNYYKGNDFYLIEK
jgi:hypothetical protein